MDTGSPTTPVRARLAASGGGRLSGSFREGSRRHVLHWDSARGAEAERTPKRGGREPPEPCPCLLRPPLRMSTPFRKGRLEPGVSPLHAPWGGKLVAHWTARPQGLSWVSRAGQPRPVRLPGRKPVPSPLEECESPFVCLELFEVFRIYLFCWEATDEWNPVLVSVIVPVQR